MPLLPIGLVLVSTFTHATWNFLAKRATNQDIFFSLSKVVEMILFAGPFAWQVGRDGFPAGHWPLFVVAAILILFYYFTLSRTYRHIDLSVGYPIARASTLFLPILAYFFIGEQINGWGLLAVVLVTVGVLVIQMDALDRQSWQRLGQGLARPGILFALLTAFIVALYTLWDKIAVGYVQPFIYYYGYTLLVTIVYIVIVIIRYSRPALRREWQAHWPSIIAVGILDMVTYYLVLLALGESKATYISLLRQLSLVTGLLLGWRFLNEPLVAPKIVGVGLLIAGASLIIVAG